MANGVAPITEMCAPFGRGIDNAREAEAIRRNPPQVRSRSWSFDSPWWSVHASRYRFALPHIAGKHVLDIASEFDISKEAAIRRYVALHHENLAVVFSRNGRARYFSRAPIPFARTWDDLAWG